MTPERERRIRSQAAAKHEREDSRLYYESTQVLLDEIDALRSRMAEAECRVERLMESMQMSIITLRHVINHGRGLDDTSRTHIRHAAERLEAALADEPANESPTGASNNKL